MFILLNKVCLNLNAYIGIFCMDNSFDAIDQFEVKFAKFPREELHKFVCTVINYPEQHSKNSK